MGISAADVKQLREATGAGMMDCKKALVKADGDFAKAEKLLKEMGLAAAAKRDDRSTEEGRVFAAVKGDTAGVMEINCETDFVAMNEDFAKVGNEILDSMIDAKSTTPSEADAAKLKETSAVIKEKMEIKRAAMMEVKAGEYAASYIHGPGKIGVIVKLASDNASIFENADVKQFAFDCALHIAAFNPAYLNADAVPADYVNEQKEIFTTQANNLGKPEKVVQGIVQGKIKKHLSEICLSEQGFVKEDKKSVAAMAKEIGKAAGGSLEVVDYIYFAVGGSN